MSDALILVERDGGIATVVLNRPAKLNALTQADVGAARRDVPHAARPTTACAASCCAARARSRSRPATTSRSSRPSARTSSRRSPTAQVMHATAHALAECRHPIVAQIHGICVGGGLEIAALADLRICGDSSRFGAPIKNLGLVMAYAEMAPLVDLVGRSVALEILLEGRIFEAQEAQDKGLVTRVVPDDQVAAEARATAAAHRRRRAAGRALAQEVRAAPAERRAADAGRARGLFRLLRHRGLPHRLRGLPCQRDAQVRRPLSFAGPTYPA